MSLVDWMNFPSKVKIIAILPPDLEAKTLIGEPLKDRDGRVIGKVVGVEKEDTLICRVLTVHAKNLDGTAMNFHRRKKS